MGPDLSYTNFAHEDTDYKKTLQSKGKRYRYIWDIRDDAECGSIFYLLYLVSFVKRRLL